MIDVEQADALFDLNMRLSGKPPLIAHFDRRVLITLPQVAATLGQEDVVTEAQAREYHAKRWVIIRTGADGDPNLPGLPIYAWSRLREYRDLSAQSFTDDELAAHAAFEEQFIDEILTGEMMEYEDDDCATLLLDLEEDRAVFGARLEGYEEWRQRCAAVGVMPDETRESLVNRVATIDRELAHLRALVPSRMSESERHRIAKRAHRVRIRNEHLRFLLVLPLYQQMRQGYGHFIAFSSTKVDENGYHFSGIRWAETLQDPVVTEETSRLPIRVPGFVLEGDRITPTRTLTPHEYARLWEEADLDEYRSVLKIVWGEKECPHCHRPVRRGGAPSRVYCSPNCAAAARQARHRQRHPDAVKRAQMRWRQS